MHAPGWNCSVAGGLQEKEKEKKPSQHTRNPRGSGDESKFPTDGDGDGDGLFNNVVMCLAGDGLACTGFPLWNLVWQARQRGKSNGWMGGNWRWAGRRFGGVAVVAAAGAVQWETTRNEGEVWRGTDDFLVWRYPRSFKPLKRVLRNRRRCPVLL